MFTASTVFLQSLVSAGITHAFVNWGSDHPALLEELERQRKQDGKTSLNIVTSPNEMVALSAAQGYAQATGKPAAVIVHVDVGTQALAGAVHNVDRSQTPVLIYAGASPFSSHGEHKGTRNEWIMWIQDIPDQSAIVRQYMRFTAEFRSPLTVSEVVNRSLQIAMSQPKGPVYISGRREVMEAEIPKTLPSSTNKWPAVEAAALSPTAVTRIATALTDATNPLIITSHLGRNHNAVHSLDALSTLLAIPVYCSCPSAVNFPFSHPNFVGVSYLPPGGHTPLLADADVILILDSDIPWIPSDQSCVVKVDARIFIVNSGDPLKSREIGMWHIPAEMICRADAELALDQIVTDLHARGAAINDIGASRAAALGKRHEEYLQLLDVRETTFAATHLSTANIVGTLRKMLASEKMDSVVLNEGITNYPAIWEHYRPDLPGSMITSGGSSLGWALGAAVGVSLAEAENRAQRKKVIIAIVGDGSYIFGVPSAAYWMARRYDTPFLTIVLNNGGWKAPKMSLLGVHPSGLGSQATGDRLSTGFGSHPPDYSQIAVAASSGWAWGKKVQLDSEDGLKKTLGEALQMVVKENRCAVLDCILESI